MEGGGHGSMAGDGTVGKALSLLDRVAAAEEPVRFSALLSDSPFPKATLHRLLRTLTGEQMLAFDPRSQTYSLGPRLMRLAHTAWRQSGLAAAARPMLDRLMAEIDQTLHLAQLDQGQVLYLDKRMSAQTVPMYSSTGKIAPAYCTGVGKAMLAHLSPDTLDQAIARQSFRCYTANTLADEAALRAELAAIRARGHAFDREEHEPGIVCVAVPIRSASGELFGGLSVTGTRLRTSLDVLERFAPRLKAAAASIAEDALIRMVPSL